MSTASRPMPLLRSVSPADGPLMRRFVETLPATAQRQRFHAVVKGCTPGLLARLTEADGRRHVAFIATVREAAPGRPAEERLVGEARYFVEPAASGLGGLGDLSAEFAISVADDWRGRGLGERLLNALLASARSQGVHWLYGDVLEDNAPMLLFAERMGFALSDGGIAYQGHGVPHCGVVRVERGVPPPPARRPFGGGYRPPVLQAVRRWVETHFALDIAWDGEPTRYHEQA